MDLRVIRRSRSRRRWGDISQFVERAVSVGVAELALDVEAVAPGVGSTPPVLRQGKRLERRFHGQPGISWYTRRSPLRIDRIGTRIRFDNWQVVGRAVPVLPEPEDAIHETVMKVEDRV